MAFPRRSPRSSRSRYTLALLLLTAVTLLVLDLPGTGPLQPVRNGLARVFSPVRSAGDAVFGPVADAWRGAFGYDELRDENDRLQARVEDEKGDDAELARLETENRDLKRLEGVTVEGIQTRAARVVSEPSSSFDPTVEIDQGTGDGVKDGMAVITGLSSGTGGGLLGRIEEVRGGRAKVQLVTAPGFAAGVSLSTGERGVLEGQGRNEALQIAQIAATVAVEEGDYVYTSGIEDSVFPADLKVGRVSAVRTSADGQFQTVEVEPLADLSSVYVKVVLKDPPQ